MTQPATRLPGPAQALCLFGLAVVTLLSPALDAGILNLDDNRLFGPGSELDAAGWSGVLDPTRTVADAWLPVSHLSLLADTRWWGGSATVAHLHSLLLHLVAAFALARLLGRLGLGRWAATAAAAVFLVHPALVESALWLSGRKDLLSGLFGFLALSTVARAAGPSGAAGRGATVAAALWTLLACYAKGTAIVLGPLAFGVAWLADRRRREAAGAGDRIQLAPAVAVLAVSVLAAVHHAWIAAGIGTMGGVGGPEDRWLQVPGAFAHYVATAFWPQDLNVLYPEVQTMQAFRGALITGLVLLGLWAAAVAGTVRHRPAVAFGLAAFAVALAPFNTAFPATALAAADRYLYLALPWLVLALAALLGRAALLTLAVLTVPLAVAANGRAADFEDSEALWEASLAVDGDNAVARLNLAQARLAAGEPLDDELLTQFEAAVDAARYPQHRWRAERRTAVALEALGRTDQAYVHAAAAAAALQELPATAQVVGLRVAEELAAARLARLSLRQETARVHLEQAEALDADAPLVLAFRAALLQGEMAAEGGPIDPDDPRLAQAEELLDRAEQADPRLYEVYWTRGLLALSAGRLLAADKAFLQAIALDPSRVEAHMARCDLYLGQPDMAATAEGAARQALKLGARDPQIRSRLAYALFQQGRFGDARAHYEAYLRLRPDDPRARRDLAAVLAAVGHQRMYQSTPEENLERAERILELDPANRKALKMKAFGLRAEKRLEAALVLLERLREELPEDREVHQLLGETLRDLGWVAKLAGEDDQAFGLFRRFLNLRAPGVPTEAVETALLQEWKQQMRAGQQALIEDDLERAEAAFRRCLELRPADSSPQLQLGMALLMGGAAEDALGAFEVAAAGQQQRGADPSLAVYYQLRALRLAGRDDEAATRGARFLEDPPEQAAEETLERIRSLLAD